MSAALPGILQKGAGAAVVFLHGIGGAAAAWQPQVEVLGEDYQAIAWDLPGYGETPALPDMTFAAISDALARLLDKAAIDACHLVGHSMGGMIAQEFAASHADRLGSLVLSGTSPAFGNPDGDFQKKFVADRLGPLEAGHDMAWMAADVVPTMIGPAADPEGTALAIACMSRVPEVTYRAMVAALITFDRRDTLGTIQVPTLVLAGDHDRQAPAAMMERMAARIPDARYHCLENCGHLANLEQPEAFNAIVSEFLNHVESRGVIKNALV